MSLEEIFQPRLVVVSETDHEITFADTEKQQPEGQSSARTYYKAPGRPIGLDVTNLTVHHQCLLRWPTRPPLPEIPPLEVVLSGKARIVHYRGLQLVNGWSERTYEVDIQLRVPGADERRREEDFAREKGFPLPHNSFATFNYALLGEEDEDKKEFWLVDCWIPEHTFQELHAALTGGRLRGLSVGVSGEWLYIDDAYDPAGKWTSWFLRADRPDSGYSRGAVCDLSFVTDEYKKAADQSSAEVPLTDSTLPEAAIVEGAAYATQLERVALALEGAQKQATRVISLGRWLVGALGAIALALLLR
jgi:hypothetical protein